MRKVRNKYASKCFRCGQPMGPGDGYMVPGNYSRPRMVHDGCKVTQPVKVQQDYPRCSQDNEAGEQL